MQSQIERHPLKCMKTSLKICKIQGDRKSGFLRPAPRNYHLSREIAKNGISPNLDRMMPLGH